MQNEWTGICFLNLNNFKISEIVGRVYCVMLYLKIYICYPKHVDCIMKELNVAMKHSDTHCFHIMTAIYSCLQGVLLMMSPAQVLDPPVLKKHKQLTLIEINMMPFRDAMTGACAGSSSRLY